MSGQADAGGAVLQTAVAAQIAEIIVLMAIQADGGVAHGALLCVIFKAFFAYGAMIIILTIRAVIAVAREQEIDQFIGRVLMVAVADFFMFI